MYVCASIFNDFAMFITYLFNAKEIKLCIEIQITELLLIYKFMSFWCSGVALGIIVLVSFLKP